MKLDQNAFHFKTSINSEYQTFWINYEIHKISPNAELSIIKIDNQVQMISILNSNLTLADIQIILLENSIDYEFVRTA
ncbi:hypothetical protein [Flavobacterium sp. 316]|uniref:hypothetical protein n=1 Tax=Flavobacterium sp. 316 TaxID=1603293 RepID=UPI00126A0345|nr:hypothetical protein [Flavobacterium sp. 316]